MNNVLQSMCVVGLCCAGVAAGAVVVQDVSKGYVPHPPGVESNAVELKEGEMHLYRDAHFEDEHFTVENIMEAQRGGLSYHLANVDLNNRLSSMRWNLPKGVLVVAYDEGSADRGPQMVLWGDGQIHELSAWDLNDKLSRMHWYYVGGQKNASGALDGGRAAPAGAEAKLSEDIKEGILVAYKSTDFRSDDQVINITEAPAGKLQKFDGSMGDSVSSLRWNLPDGVVIVLYQDDKPTSEQRAVWGKGELPRLGDWDFNDRGSRWAWYYIGDVVEN